MLTTAPLLEALASPNARTRLANRLAVVAPRLGACPQSEAVRLALGVILALHRVEADAEAQGEAPL